MWKAVEFSVGPVRPGSIKYIEVGAQKVWIMAREEARQRIGNK